MTVSALAKILCLVSGIFGRPAWEAAKCDERASMLSEAAEGHHLDPLLLVAIDVVECDLGVEDAKFRENGRVAGIDACPMGVRLRGRINREDYPPPVLYEIAAKRLDDARRRCRGRRCRGHFVSMYNWGNRDYAAEVLAVAAALGSKSLGRRATARSLPQRIAGIVRKIATSMKRAEDRT